MIRVKHGFNTGERKEIFSEPGLLRVFDAQIKAGLLPASRTFDITRYMAGGYPRSGAGDRGEGLGRRAVTVTPK